MAESTTLISLQSENAVLRQKLKILEPLNKENTTKYKDVELQLTLQHEKKEDEYITKINQLQQLINKQKTAMKLLKIDSLSKQSTQSQSLYDQNAKYKKRIKSSQQKINEQELKIKRLEFRVQELETLNQQKENERARRSNAKKMQLASIIDELEQYRSLEPIKSKVNNDSQSVIKIGSYNASKSDSSNIEKKETDPVISKQDTLTPKIYNIYSMTLQRTEPDEVDGDLTQHNDGIAIVPKQETMTYNLTDSTTTSIEPTLRNMLSKQTINENMEMEIKLQMNIVNEIVKPEEYRTAGDKLVIKQLPCAKSTHFWMNLYIEMNGEIIVIFLNRNCTVNMLLDILKLSDVLSEMFANDNIAMHAANEDFQMDDSCAVDGDVIISKLGIMNACIKCNDGIGDIQPLIHDKSGFDVNMDDLNLKLLHLQQSKSKPNDIDIQMKYHVDDNATPLTPEQSDFDKSVRSCVCCIVL